MPSRSPAAQWRAPTSENGGAGRACTGPTWRSSPTRGPIAVEVELTPKAPRRLYELIRAWRHAVGRRTVAEVHYLCEPGQTRRAVERAVAKVRAEQFIAIGEAPER